MDPGQGFDRSQVRHSGISIMSNDYVELPRKPIADCLTCTLCKNIYREATTISVCLHTFCKDCIYQKFEEDEANCCPVCEADLGSSPKETLRPDHNYREIVTQIFPFESSTRREQISIAPQVNNTRREEISLAPQVNNTTPEVTKHNASGAKDVPQDSGTSQETIGKIHDDRGFKEKNNHMDQTPSPTSSNYSSTASQKQQNSWEMELPQVAHTLSEPMAHVDYFKEANKGPSQKHLSHHKEGIHKEIDLNNNSSNIPAFNAKNKDKVQTKKKRNKNRRPRESLFAQRKEDKMISSNVMGEMPKPDQGSVGRTTDPGELTSEHELVKEAMKLLRPIWFCLVACEDKDGNTMPQIPKRYIKIKLSVPTSGIKANIAKVVREPLDPKPVALCLDLRQRSWRQCLQIFKVKSKVQGSLNLKLKGKLVEALADGYDEQASRDDGSIEEYESNSSDRDMPVRYIKRYLVEKLNLQHESEVEVMCHGEPLIQSLTLKDLVDIWVLAKSRTGPVHLKRREGISNGKNFVMDLTYRRSKENGAPQRH
ncbi:hypothetical protein L1049_022301 [Liquidambar formosana]|uniref:RING-type domain-containing protein n=1 Tax=Liquidambar formosana TaxID=63359 RepID=A0AAP0RCC4_LIQFO